jgi:hypothetical protein
MEHRHQKLDLELSDLRARVDQMGRIVVEQIETALQCLRDPVGVRAGRNRAPRDQIISQ